jgi:hypothetical protein
MVITKMGKIFRLTASWWEKMRRHQAKNAPTAIPSCFIMLPAVIHVIKHTVMTTVSKSYIT